MNNKKSWIIILIIIATIFIISFVPFEQWIFRFDTPEEALKFNFADRVEVVVSKVEVDNFAYITYVDKSGSLKGRYIEKDDRGWISPIKKIVISNKLKLTNEYRIRNYIEGKQNLIIISNGTIEKNKLIQKVSDSIGTKFKEESYEYNGTYHKKWIGIVKEYPEDYKIYLDEEKVEF